MKFNKFGIAKTFKFESLLDRNIDTLQRYYNNRYFYRLNKALCNRQNADRLANNVQRQNHANVTNGKI